MACCLMVPSYYLNQCWLLIRKFKFFHLRTISQKILQPSITKVSLKMTYLKPNSIFRGPMSYGNGCDLTILTRPNADIIQANFETSPHLSTITWFRIFESPWGLLMAWCLFWCQAICRAIMMTASCRSFHVRNVYITSDTRWPGDTQTQAISSHNDNIYTVKLSTNITAFPKS